MWRVITGWPFWEKVGCRDYALFPFYEMSGGGNINLLRIVIILYSIEGSRTDIKNYIINRRGADK